MKVLYVVSTLKRSGPVNQLYNIVSGVVKKGGEACVITLSPEPLDSLKARFDELEGVEIRSLELSRVSGLFWAKTRLLNELNSFSPDIIHTQGARADGLLSGFPLSVRKKWILTSRNYPWVDYPMKFGRLKGALLALQHVRAQKKCLNLVACSSAIEKQLRNHGISAITIRNGTRSFKLDEAFSFPLGVESPVFVTVGSLIARKNVSLLLTAFNDYKSVGGGGALIIVGSGPLEEKLKSEAGEAVHFIGDTSDVGGYLAVSDCFVSASVSEGMPNAVLESLLMGLPALLSDIEPHAELFSLAGNSKVKLFSSENELLDLLKRYDSLGLESGCSVELERELSHETMLDKYWEQYLIVSGMD